MCLIADYEVLGFSLRKFLIASRGFVNVGVSPLYLPPTVDPAPDLSSVSSNLSSYRIIRVLKDLG